MSAFDDLYLEYKDGKHIPDKMYVWLKDFYNAGRALGKKEGMERAAEMVENSHHAAGNVFEALAEAIRKEIK